MEGIITFVAYSTGPTLCLIGLSSKNVLKEIHLFLSQIAKIYIQSQNAEKQLYGITIVEFRYGICNYLSLTCNHVIIVKRKKKENCVRINDSWRALEKS